MSTVAEQLTDLVRLAAESAGFTDTDLTLEACSPSQRAGHGDYQSNYAFRLGKALRTNPRAVAASIAEKIEGDPRIERVEVAGPGFINLTLTNAALCEFVTQMTESATLCVPQVGQGQTMVIDFSSPNVAKRMHIGHLRSTVIGHALYSIQKAVGFHVIGDNHIGDWGTQFGMLIVGWNSWRDEAAYESDPIAELQRIYQLFRERCKSNPELEDQARSETAKLQAGDATNRALWQSFVEVSMVEFNRLYQRLGVAFDVVHGESFYRDGLSDLVADLLESGLAKRDAGAVIIPFTADDGKSLKDRVLLVQKSDGAALYGTTDLATVRYRMAEFKPSCIAYVTDNRQQLHFQQIFCASKKMGVEVDFKHVYFGMLRFEGGEIASTRSGAVVNLVDVLDTAVKRARAVVDQKSAHLPEEERALIAEAVGVSAIRYADLSQNPQSDILFSWEKMLSLEGNTAPYLLYAYARCQSILRRAAEQGLCAGALHISEPRERELALALARTPERILASAHTWRPNVVCDHLYQLASSFAGFYAECRVLDDSLPAEIVASRLAFTSATAHTLGVGFSLIGLKALDRM